MSQRKYQKFMKKAMTGKVQTEYVHGKSRFSPQEKMIAAAAMWNVLEKKPGVWKGKRKRRRKRRKKRKPTRKVSQYRRGHHPNSLAALARGRQTMKWRRVHKEFLSLPPVGGPRDPFNMEQYEKERK